MEFVHRTKDGEKCVFLVKKGALEMIYFLPLTAAVRVDLQVNLEKGDALFQHFL